MDLDLDELRSIFRRNVGCNPSAYIARGQKEKVETERGRVHTEKGTDERRGRRGEVKKLGGRTGLKKNITCKKGRKKRDTKRDVYGDNRSHSLF